MHSKDQIDVSHFSSDIVDFLRLLEKHQVQYLVVGGEAVIFYGHARLTGDIDFFYKNSIQNANALYKSLLEFWGGSIPGIQSPDELQEPNLIIQFGVPPNRIDLLNRISGVEFEEAWRNRCPALILIDKSHCQPIYFIGIKELVINKQASGRPKDLADVPYLQR